METAVQRHKFTVDEYHWMGRVGILCADARVELIEGEIIDMTPIGGRHAWCVNLLTRILVTLLGDRAFVNVQNPIRLSEDSEPQPDLAVLKLEARRRIDVPHASDVLLVIEAADSSLAHDRRTKLPLYARAGIPEAWIVDLTRDRVEVYRDPGGDGYASRTVYERAGAVSLLAFPDITIRCEEILP
jgi:Uma2 family endonuclease